MSELKVEKERVLEAMKQCPEFARIAKTLFGKEVEPEQPFEVGDIVKTIDKNEMGIVKVVKPAGSVGVEFFEVMSGHDIDGLAYDGHGWYFIPGNIGDRGDFHRLALVYRPKK